MSRAAALWKPIRRILVTLPVLWVVVSVVFLLIHLVPGDPIVQMLGEGAAPGQVEQCSPATTVASSTAS